MKEREAIMTSALRGPFTSVDNGGAPSCGGNQAWSPSRVTRDCGCGVVACADLLLYLRQSRSGCANGLFCDFPESGPVPSAPYLAAVEKLRRGFIPLLPRFGVNGFALVLGLNAYFIRYRLPFRAFWGVSGGALWPRIREMLSRDIPVILAIGPDLPKFWQKHPLTLYTRQSGGSFRSACQARAHYVTVTAMDDAWLRVSSWGREYYINRKEYDARLRSHSLPLVCNAVCITEI